jgi:hypothetical protein
MTLTAEAATATSAAVLHYFEGERLEMGVILAGSLGLALLAGVLYFISRDGFATGVLVTVLLCASLLSGAVDGCSGSRALMRLFRSTQSHWLSWQLHGIT